MLRAIAVVLVLCGLATGAAIGCSSKNAPLGDQPATGAGDPSATDFGAVAAQLTLPGGEHLGIASYTMTNGTNTYNGPINISQTATLSFTIGSVAAGAGYTLTLSSTSDDGTVSCTGTAGPFAVVNRTTTTVFANMQCTSNLGRDAGSVLINGVLSNCPVWNTIVANPLNITLDAGANVNDGGSPGSSAFFPGTTPVPATINVGDSLVLVASATGPDPGSMAFKWTSAAGGSLSSQSGTIDPNSTDAGTTDQTVFTCQGAGLVTVTLMVSDGPLPDGGNCDARFTTATVTVNCQAPATCSFGTGCGDGGQICNASGSCVPALFSVLTLQSIDGGVIDSLAKNLPMFIQKYSLTGPVGSPIALPTSGAGAISVMGNFVTEGDLTTSADGRYLCVLGQNAVPGNAQTQGPIIARIDALGNVDTSTVPPSPFNLDAGGQLRSFRSCASNDGSGFWISGSVNDSTGGIWYVSYPSGGVSQFQNQLVQFPNPNPAIDPITMVDPRWLRIFNGQLYAGTDYFTPYMFQVGSGLPTTGMSSVTTLPGFQNGGVTDGGAPPVPSPYGFLMFAIAAPGGQPDTLYIADDGMNSLASDTTTQATNTNGTDLGLGGLQKWKLNSMGQWQKVWNLTAGTFPPDASAAVANKPIGFRGLAGFATGTQVTLMATTGNVTGLPDSLTVILQDDGSSTSTTPPTFQTLAQSGVTTVFRGVALTPQ